MAMVFQSYALYPHLTVARNLEFPLRQRGVEHAEREKTVADVAETAPAHSAPPTQTRTALGGQRQRVALGRAIVRQPSVFLMDEPLSNLDAALRAETRAEIVALQQRLATTTMYVTHDQVEAMTMGDRIAVVSAGVLQQVTTPKDLYALPANIFVAGFLGNPPMNLLPATVTTDTAGSTVLRLAGGEVPLPPAYNGSRLPKTVTAGVRPEALALDPQGSLSAAMTIAEVLGAEVHVIARLPDGTRLIVRQDAKRALPNRDEPIRIALTEPGSVLLFDSDSGDRLQAA